MAAVSTIIGVAGLATSLAGTVASIHYQEERSEAMEKAEKARQASANLTARRGRRKMIRQSIIARSEALANTTSRGAQSGSALPGTQGQIAGETNRAIGTLNQQQQLGNRVFSANQRAYSAGSSAATASGFASLGGTIFQNRGEISTLGQTLFS